ncbi:MAG: hypothetical protein ACI88G_000934 [Woeseiaceae bacterium]
MFKDAHDLEVTCASDAAMQAYLSGIECSLRFDGPAVDEFAEAVSLDEEFALAHAALGRQLFIHGRGEECSAHLDAALSLKESVTQREQDAIGVIERAARFDPQAMALAYAHVATYPQDIYVLAHLLGPFGMLAFSGITDFCARNIALLEETRSSYPVDSWWHAANRGFFAAEQGNLSLARKECELAWSLSENGNSAHAMAHMHFEADALDEGREFIADWASKYGSQSDMRHHLMWHTSLIDMESGADIEQIATLYDRELDPNVNDPTPLETLCDNASFLWRCLLAGKKMPAAVSEELLAYAETHFSHIGFAFADVHRAMATALHPDKNKHSEFVSALADVSRRSGTRVAECVCLFAEAFGAFVNESYDEVVAILEPIATDSVLIGGSNPQRRIIEETLVEACKRSGQTDKAADILRSRNNSAHT